MMSKKWIRVAAVSAMIGMAGIQAAHAEACMSDVSAALDKQRESYIAAQSSLADQNYSRRPGSFASTTCLGDLMKGGGLDIFFKPPSLDSIIGMVKNLACEQASQIFDKLVGGSGINGGGMLNPGELLSGVNFGGMQNAASKLGSLTGNTGLSGGGSIMDLYK